MGISRSNKNFQFMNNYQFGKLLSSYVENFAESIEQSDKIRSAIDNIFENQTRHFFNKQLTFFTCLFMFPFLAHLFLSNDALTDRILLSTALVGWFYMYSNEVIAMIVEGFWTYFK